VVAVGIFNNNDDDKRFAEFSTFRCRDCRAYFRRANVIVERISGVLGVVIVERISGVLGVVIVERISGVPT
jgi:hypothetical protein